MDVRFTRHAKNRMRWRGITKTEVQSVLSNPDAVERLSQDKKNYFKIISKRRIRVTAIQEERELVVITAVVK
ncbi:MAG: hypothetical protein UY76_C0014G0007 [Candidatus Uhrbacteria bacterium GW2011_GWA2_52_8d]|uniref:DUF4258 domain-containing protein n=1 Tax=Candidatus Uhrbacteria bacterium GW2011_GWA2_52_8d TaxID=1618979 RepID=A0A0G2AJV8_9BACT|nr:MAG: hypothetical protein UY76_C0014G0007 [Candidatus Uhrbacteria bacterium GW2011_GWA2_52_8d]